MHIKNTRNNDVRFELMMDAGNGAQKIGHILIKALLEKGLGVFSDPVFPSEINPPKHNSRSMSGFILRVSTQKRCNSGSFTDLMILEHELFLENRLNERELTPDTAIWLDDHYQEKFSDNFAAQIKRAEKEGLHVNLFHVDNESRQLITSLKGHGKNLYYLGMFCFLLQLDLEKIEFWVKNLLPKLSDDQIEINLNLVRNGFTYAKTLFRESYDIPVIHDPEPQIMMDGNTALALGIVDAGILLYSGYPITPATSIMHTLADIFPSYGGTVHQAEDEISAIGTAIGAYFAGTPAITATSGPGLCLKQELIGFSQAAEIPLIVVDVQRAGPSTGMPTYTEQSDLAAAMFGSSGDNTRLVISVSSARNCFYAPAMARYLAEKLRMPVILLSDSYLSTSEQVFRKPLLSKLDTVTTLPEHIFRAFDLTPLPDEVPMVKTHQAIPGTPDGMRRVTGLNTNEDGHVSYSAEDNIRANQIRNEKLLTVKNCLKLPRLYGKNATEILEGHAAGNLLIISWGSTKGAVREAIDALNDAGLDVYSMHFKFINPLPWGLRELFMKFRCITTAETVQGNSARHSVFALLLRDETLCDIQSAICIPSGRTLKPFQIIEKAKSLLSDVKSKAGSR